jgi:TolB-like protein
MKKTLWMCLSVCCLTSIALAQPTQVSTQTKANVNVLAASGSTIASAQNTLDQRLADLSRQIAENLTENQKRTIAVVEFSDLKGTVTNFGRFLSEELITRLYQTKKFKVIERQQLNKIIAEQKLSLTGVVDTASAQKLGRVLGVDSIVSGSISDLVRTLKINARLISTETGEVFAAAAVEIVKDEAVCSLMGDCGRAESASPSPTPGPRPSPTPRRTSSRIADSHFFHIELQQCRLSGTSVLCYFVITNTDRDRRLGINSGTRMFDDFGNEAGPRGIQIADKTGNSYADATLISGVPTKARVGFEGVSAEATKMTLFRLEFYGDDGNFNIEFRNVPLREQASSEDGSAPGGAETTTVRRSNQQTTVHVYPGRQWTDAGIEVEPGMQLNVNVRGSLATKRENRAVSDILSGVLKQRVNLPSSTKTVGPNALLAKIRYRNGRDSKTITVGEKNTLLVEANEYGRLYFGIIERYANSNGSFTVTVSW